MDQQGQPPLHRLEAPLLVVVVVPQRKAPQTEGIPQLIVSDCDAPTPSANLWLGVFRGNVTKTVSLRMTDS